MNEWRIQHFEPVCGVGRSNADGSLENANCDKDRCWHVMLTMHFISYLLDKSTYTKEGNCAQTYKHNRKQTYKHYKGTTTPRLAYPYPQNAPHTRAYFAFNSVSFFGWDAKNARHSTVKWRLHAIILCGISTRLQLDHGHRWSVLTSVWRSGDRSAAHTEPASDYARA